MGSTSKARNAGSYEEYRARNAVLGMPRFNDALSMGGKVARSRLRDRGANR